MLKLLARPQNRMYELNSQECEHQTGLSRIRPPTMESLQLHIQDSTNIQLKSLDSTRPRGSTWQTTPSDSYRQRHDVVNTATKQQHPSQSRRAEKHRPSIPNAPPPTRQSLESVRRYGLFLFRSNKQRATYYSTDIDGQSRSQTKREKKKKVRLRVCDCSRRVGTKTHQRESSLSLTDAENATRPAATCSRHLQPRALRVGKGTERTRSWATTNVKPTAHPSVIHHRTNARR
jgi:hypothetical protein